MHGEIFKTTKYAIVSPPHSLHLRKIHLQARPTMGQVEVELAPSLQTEKVSERILHEKGEKYVLPVDNEEHERFAHSFVC